MDLALRGMKKELKGVIRRSMKERKVKWVSLKELRELAVSAEVEKFDLLSTHKTAMFNNKYIPKPASKTQQSAITVGAVELRDPKRKDIPATQQSIPMWYMWYA